MGVKANRILFVCGNCSGHYSTELKKHKHNYYARECWTPLYRNRVNIEHKIEKRYGMKHRSTYLIIS